MDFCLPEPSSERLPWHIFEHHYHAPFLGGYPRKEKYRFQLKLGSFPTLRLDTSYILSELGARVGDCQFTITPFVIKSRQPYAGLLSSNPQYIGDAFSSSNHL